MTTSHHAAVVNFSSAFLLPGFDAPQPAGDCLVDHDGEAIEEISRFAWRGGLARSSTCRRLPGRVERNR